MPIDDQNRALFDANRNNVPSLNGKYSIATGAMTFENFLSANGLAGRVIQTDGTSTYGADVVVPSMGGQQNNNFSWPNVIAGIGQIIRIEEMIYPQGDIKNYGLDVSMGPPPINPPPPPPPSAPPPPGPSMHELPAIRVASFPEVVITSPANNDTVSSNWEVVIVATSDPYVGNNGALHPLPLLAQGLYGYMNSDGLFVATRLLPVLQQSYVADGQRRKYKFLFKRAAHDVDAHQTFLGVVAASLYGFVTDRKEPARFPYSACLIKLNKI
jgi:hypothetical protein